MGTARTTEGFTPIVHAEDKDRLLREHRDDVLASVDDVLLAPLERAARRVEEDLCVLIDGRFVAGCVCFPSHWRLRDKLGRLVGDVHERVPGYASELNAKVDSFLRRLTTGTVVVRRNFAIHELPDLFAPDRPTTLGVPPAEQWLRSERQTLRRLQRSDAVLFAIRTQQVQLQHVDELARRTLGARLQAEPEGLIGYRNLTDRLPALIGWLDP